MEAVLALFLRAQAHGYDAYAHARLAGKQSDQKMDFIFPSQTSLFSAFAAVIELERIAKGIRYQ